MKKQRMIGTYIKLKRIEMDLTASELAKLSSYSRSYISQIENDKIEPPEEVRENIFKCLNLDYSKYKINNLDIMKKKEIFIKSIVFNDNTLKDKIYKKIINDADNIDYSYYNIILLIKFIYYIENGNYEDVEMLIREIYESLDYLENNDKQLFLIYIGKYYMKSENYVKIIKNDIEAIKLGTYQYITSIGYVDIAQTYEKKGNNLLSFMYYQRAENLFIYDQNYDQIINVKIKQANLLLTVEAYEEAFDIYEKLIRNDIINENIKNEIKKNYIFCLIKSNKFEKALDCLSSFKRKDEIVLWRLYCYYMLNLIKEYDALLKTENLKIMNKIIKDEIQILNMKKENEKDASYESLLLMHLKDIQKYGDKYLVLSIYDELIDYYKKIKKYKEACYYMQKMVKNKEC